jgi:hypothetical protein
MVAPLAAANDVKALAVSVLRMIREDEASGRI